MIYARPAVPSLAKSDSASHLHLSTEITKKCTNKTIYTHTHKDEKVFNSIFMPERKSFFSAIFAQIDY
jgi:hypothetical protein